MALFNIPWLTESLKKCTIKYLIERYLGHFLSEELDLSQLDIELFNGTASIESIPLNVQTINQELSTLLSLKFLEGFVEKIEFMVPWSSLWIDSCTIRLDGIRLNFCKLKQQQQPSSSSSTNQTTTTTSILSRSMMVSSMEMAEEILEKQESEKYEGLEKFAQLISSIIRRVKLSAKNTRIKFQFPSGNGGDGDEIEFRIGHLRCEEEEITLDGGGPGSGKDGQQSSTTKDKESSSDKTSNLLLSDIVTKRLTLEGIEIYINDNLITKLFGKHSLKLRFNQNRIDMDVYLGSYLFAILNSNHIRILKLFFQMMNDDGQQQQQQQTEEESSTNKKPQERLMTAQDYRRIQELMHKENHPHPHHHLPSMKQQSINGGGRTWTTIDSNDDQFKSFDHHHHHSKDNDGTKKDGGSKSANDASCSSDPNQNTLVTCNIKIPGIMLCLISNDDNDDNMPEFNEIPIIDNLQTFIGINSFLNDILHEYNHIRLLASNICLELRNQDYLQFSCINISSYEYHHNVDNDGDGDGILNNLFWINDNNVVGGGGNGGDGQNSDSTIIPSIRLKKNKNLITIMLAPTFIRLDPTIIERHQKLFELFLPSLTDVNPAPPPVQCPTKLTNINHDNLDDEDSIIINIECENLEMELFFPIPDLRPERNDYSCLHNEILLIVIKQLSTRIENDFGELLCNEISMDLRIDNDNDDDDNDNDGQYKLFHSKCDERNIKLHYSTSIPIEQTIDINQTFENNDDNGNNVVGGNSLINQLNSMNESINFLQSSAINHNNQSNEPFQIKRNMFGDNPNGTNNNNGGHERIITPGDRDHCRHYLAYNRELTRFYIYIHLPYGEIYLDNKRLFELIYNRFVNDLIMWRPFFRRRKLSSSSMVKSKTNNPPKLLLPMLNETLTDDDDDDDDNDWKPQPKSQPPPPQNSSIFYSCKNVHNMDSSSTSSSSIFDSTLSNNSYHSIMMDKIMDDDDDDDQNKKKSLMNEFVVELELDNLMIKFQTKSSSPISTSMVKNEIFMQNFLLGIVGGPASDLSKTVITLCSENLRLNSNDRSILINNSYLDLNSELNLAVEIRRENELLKKIKLTVQLKNAILLGLDLPVFENLWEFINVHDDDIIGYVCPRVIIELHLDLMKSGIVFDCLKDRQTLIHFEDIYLTSMVIENTEQTILRFFIEEALLCFKRQQHSMDYLKNFIPIIDSGIIDINLKISKDGQIEWKGSNNEINLKVCYDSLAALCQFLQTFSAQSFSGQNSQNDGHLSQNSTIVKDSKQDKQNDKTPPTTTTINQKDSKNSLNSNELLADALSELSVNDNNGNDGDGDDNDEFTIRSSLRKEKNCFCSDNLSSNNNNKMDESNFLILGENDLGSGIHTSKEPRIRMLIDEPIKIIENHFKITQISGIPDMTATTIARYLLDRMSLNVYLYAGKDFDDDQSNDNNDDDSTTTTTGNNKRSNSSLSSDIISQVNYSLKNENLMNKSTQQQRVRFKQQNNSILWENIDLISTTSGSIKSGSKSSRITNPVDTHFSFKSTGGFKRKTDTYVVLVLKRIRILFDQYDKNELISWLFRFMVQELEIIDKVSVSKINKMLYEYYSESMPRRQYSNMFSIRMTCFRNFQDKFEEADLTISLKPLRINVDQDTLLFLMDFFTKFNDILMAKLTNTGDVGGGGGSKQLSDDNNDLDDDNNSNASATTIKKFENKLTINIDNDDNDDDNDDDISIKNPPTLFTIDQSPSLDSNRTIQITQHQDSMNDRSNSSLFIKSFTFLPDVPIRLDYHGKHIDLKQGALPGIALGLAQLNQSELYLKKLSNKHGLLGLDKVIQYAIEEWGRDIKRNQLPSILGGVGPMHSFIQLFQGIRDLFWIPIDQYRRDQRIVRGIQRGAYAFSVSTAMATLELANRLVVLIQNTAQFAHNVVTPPTPGNGHYNRHQLIPASSQPRDLREGFTVAYTVIREGFHDTFRGMTNTNLVADDTVTVIGEVVRQIPSTVVRPIIHLSQATSSVLVGFRNQLTPEARKDDQEKWKNANDW
ncbi:Autophagy protein [Dermatophagoides pteronyssinus]|uniref:Autophagy-related protein 2 n=1 Tax=Dermatophagoides pteronyssinus TaxID=6956 RepID=A0ABQ8JID4_DERPT|nr:Autophagy protein [Dermatophagoides pteronyssinus]